MKRIFRNAVIMTTAILAAVSMQASDRQAKEAGFRQKFPYKYEFRIGWAGYPIVDGLEYGNGIGCCDIGPMYNDPGHWYENYSGPDYMTGIISGEFSIHFKRWFTLAVELGVNGLWGYDMDPETEQRVARRSGAVVHIIPTARFYYVNTRGFRLYSSVGLGLAAGRFRGYATLYPAFQIAPIGFTAGKRVFFFAETALGSSRIGGKMGIGFRF